MTTDVYKKLWGAFLILLFLLLILLVWLHKARFCGTERWEVCWCSKLVDFLKFCFDVLESGFWIFFFFISIYSTELFPFELLKSDHQSAGTSIYFFCFISQIWTCKPSTGGYVRCDNVRLQVSDVLRHTAMSPSLDLSSPHHGLSSLVPLFQ